MLLAILLIGILVLIPVINVVRAYFMKYPSQEIIKIGHRGAAGLAPENTLFAIDSGLSYHVNYIEIDVRETRDGQIIVMHDKTVDRTTNGTGAVDDLTYPEIAELDASQGFKQYSVVKVPLLRDVLLRIKESTAKLLIEIKDPSLYPDILSKIEAILKETQTLDQVAIFSFDKSILGKAKGMFPKVETGVFSISFEYTFQNVEYISPNWISVLYFPSIIDSIHKHGKKVLVWTPDNAFWMKYLLKWKVDGIITNRPDILNSVLY